MRKIYDIYDSPGGPTCSSRWYALFSKRMWKVAAYSAKQAVYLAEHRMWYAGSKVGILAHMAHRSDSPWTTWDGRTTCTPGWTHLKPFED